MATRAAAIRTRSMQEPGDLKAMELCNAGSQSPSAAHLPHSSDDSSATVRLDSCLTCKTCSSPTSELLPEFTQHENPAGPDSQLPATTSPSQAPAAAAGRSHSPVTPAVDADVPAVPQENISAACKHTAKAAAQQQASLVATPPPPPDACEGPEAAAEYEAYMQRWAAGHALAQRWARLEASGKAVWLREEWEDHQLDMLLQQHCSNTPQAAAARAAAAQTAAARAHAQVGSPRGTRRGRADLEVDLVAAAAGEEGHGAAASPGGRRVRSRQAPKSFRDFEVSLPAGGRSLSGAVSDDTVAAAAAAAGAAAGATAAGAAAGAEAGEAAGAAAGAAQGSTCVFFAGSNGSSEPSQQQQQQPKDMDFDVYIGAGILLDLCSGPAAPAPQGQQKLRNPQQQQQQQKQQGAPQHSRKKVVMHKTQAPKLRPPQQQQPQSQQASLLPVVQTKPKPLLVLDLSRSPRHSQASSGDDSPVTASGSASAAAAAAAVRFAAAAASGMEQVLAKPGSPQQQMLLLPSGLHSPGALSVSRMAAPQQLLQLPPRHPKPSLSMAHRLHHHQQQQQVHFALQRQQHMLNLTAQQPQQPQQQQQQGGVAPVYLQEALQVASQLGTVLGGNSEAFARVVSFVSQHSHQPTALCQFMSVTLSQLQQGQPAQQALDAAAAAAAAAVTAATATATAAAAAAARAATVQPASPSGKPQQQQYKVGLML